MLELVVIPCLCFSVSVYRQYSVGFEMVTVSTVGDPGPAACQKKSSGDYRYSRTNITSQSGNLLSLLNNTLKFICSNETQEIILNNLIGNK